MTTTSPSASMLLLFLGSPGGVFQGGRDSVLFVDKGASQVCVSTYYKHFGSGTKVIKRIPHIGRLVKGEVNQKGKNSVVIRGHIRDHFHIIYKFEGNLNPELQADMSISVYFVNVLIPKVITSYKVFCPYISTSFCSLIHFIHCSFFP